jgi:hypothetical protein
VSVPASDLGPPPLSHVCVYAPPPQDPRGGGEVTHSPGGAGVGESQFRRLEKSLALCLLCGNYLYFGQLDFLITLMQIKVSN